MEQTHLSFKCMDTTPNKLKMMVSTQARLWSPAVNFGGDDLWAKGKKRVAYNERQVEGARWYAT